MKYRYTYYIMLLLFSIMRMNSTFAQIDTIPFFEDINWSDYLGDNDEQTSEHDLTEELEEFFYSDKTFNVNTLDPKEAIEILKMSDYQYYQLQLYITKYGHLLSLAELTSVEGFTSSDFLRLKP